jgi:hypothetical protein
MEVSPLAHQNGITRPGGLSNQGKARLPTSVQRLEYPARKYEGHCLPVLDKPGIRGYTIHIGYIQCG